MLRALILILILLSALLLAAPQSDPNENLLLELIKDLDTYLFTTFGEHYGSDRVRFEEENDQTRLIMASWPDQSHPDSTASEIVLSLERMEITVRESSASGNSGFSRELALAVKVLKPASDLTWEGKMSDHLDVRETRGLLDEPGTIPLDADLDSSEPSWRLVILTGVGLLTLISALFFIRT